MVADAVMEWLSSGLPAFVAGLCLRPRPSPHLPGAVLCIQRGQAEVYFTTAVNGSGWVLKKFLPGKRPNGDHLASIAHVLPRHPGLGCGTDRRVLESQDLKHHGDAYFDPELRDWLDGVVLMPEVTGTEWSVVAMNIRNGTLNPSPDQRRALCASLSAQVEKLEIAGCAHRDLSSGNVLVIPSTGQTELIDFDAVFHRTLAMPTNILCGTLGYMAPFLSRPDGWDAASTWCPMADRFALTLLNAEFLITRNGSPQGNDGGLFSQDELVRRKGKHIDHARHFLNSEYPEAVPLYEAVIRSEAYRDCPEPRAWLDLYSGNAGHGRPPSNLRIPCLADMPTVQLPRLQIPPPVQVALPADPWKKVI